MVLLKLIGILNPIMFVLAIVGFALCVKALLRGWREKKKEIPFISMIILLVPLLFIISSKKAVTELFRELVTDSEVSIEVRPNSPISPRDFLKDVFQNLYTFKKQSGTRPTEEKHTIVVCKNDICGEIEVAMDSKDSNMYWVGYKLSSSSTIPLGYTSLTLGVEN